MTTHEKKVRQLKERMLEVSYKNQQGFLPSAFSILDILVTLYYEIMEEEDQFVLSKGHAAFGLYAVLEDKGILEKGELDTFGQYRSRLSLMAERGISGVLFSTGSLGHGLPEAVGMAYGNRVKKRKNRVFTVIGDGELNEGTNWEAMLAAFKFGLDHLVCILDNNHTTEQGIDLTDLRRRFEAFNWHVEEINGHKEQELADALNQKHHVPYMIIANTIKGKGCSLFEQQAGLWHSKAPNEEEYKMLLKELNEND